MSDGAAQPLPGGAVIVRRYQDFQGALPALCDALAVKPSELRFRDYANIVKVWLTPPAP